MAPEEPEFYLLFPQNAHFYNQPCLGLLSASGGVLCHWSFFNIQLGKGEEWEAEAVFAADNDVASNIVLCSLYWRVGTMSSVYCGPHLTPSH